MFMRHVTEIMANGPTGFELSQLGLTITQVKVCQHYNGLNIFWTATATDDYDMVERKLESIKKSVRHQLHQMQVMGNVPHITFVRDCQLSYFDEVQTLFSKADYGDEYEPSLTKQANEKSAFDIHGDECSATRSSIPPMRQDVFGVDHAQIMGRIKQSMAKSKQAWDAYDKKLTNQSDNLKPYTFSTSFESIRQEHETEKSSAQNLKEFLVKRKQMRKEKRSEQMECNALLYDEWMRLEHANSNDYDDAQEPQPLEDEHEIEKFYDEYDSIDE